MSDVKVGMRLVSKDKRESITVTEITEKGFKYKPNAAEPVPFIPRWGMSFAIEGHEHYGLNGEAWYEVEQLSNE